MKSYFNLHLLIFLTLVFNSSCREIHRCETTDDCLSSFNCIEGYCVHKDLFPMTLVEIFVMLFLASMSVIATSAGVGGGAVYSAILMFVENFSAMEAFPISNFTILMCAMTSFYIGVKDKMRNPDTKFVDYDSVLIFVPTMLLGTKIGVLLNKILPSFLLNILLILSLAYSSYKSYKNAIKQKELESRKVPIERLRTYSVEDILVIEEEMFREMCQIQGEKKPLGGRSSRKIEYNIDMLNHEYFYNNENKGNIMSNLFHGEKSPIKLDRIKSLVMLEAVMIIDQLLEGNDKIPSFIGISRCSNIYWLVFSSYIVFCIWYARFSSYKIQQDSQNRVSLMSADSSEFKITSPEAQNKINKILLFCFMAGIISGMLGVGGGILMAPLMLELGMHPKTASSTSNFLLIITSSAGTILFILSNQLIYSYAIALAIPCCLASLLGSKYITDYVARTKKNSLLVYLLFYVMIFSLIILPINGIRRAMYDMKMGESIFEIRDYC